MCRSVINRKLTTKICWKEVGTKRHQAKGTMKSFIIIVLIITVSIEETPCNNLAFGKDRSVSSTVALYSYKQHKKSKIILLRTFRNNISINILLSKDKLCMGKLHLCFFSRLLSFFLQHNLTSATLQNSMQDQTMKT